MKGRMFVITMIFLIGLIFAVQNNLSQYAFVDLATAFERNDLPLLKAISSSFSHALESSLTCEEAGKNLQELESFLESRAIKGTSIRIDQILDCSNWGTPNPALSLTINLKSLEIETRDTLFFFR